MHAPGWQIFIVVPMIMMCSVTNNVAQEITTEAWSGPSWKQAAAEYHHARGNNVLIVEIPPEDFARLRRLMGDDISPERAWAEFNDSRNRPTPKATVDAILFAVKKRGLTALQEPATKARVASCDAKARAEINKQIEQLGLRS
jgi:hypothetical protein